MIRYTLDVLRNGRKWCAVTVDTPDAASLIADLAGMFGADAGYSVTLWCEKEARRIVEVTDQARLIGVQYDRTPVAIEALLARSGGPAR